jgi:hypothetical protein
MKYVLTESQFNKLLKESREPSMSVISKLFRMLNDEKKKHKTRDSLIKVIENYAPYINIPKQYSLYLLELYLLNFRKDGDYSELTKGNFVDPRKMKGKTTTNPKSKKYTIAQLPFKASNLSGYWSKDSNGKPYYKVVSWGWYPIYIFKDDKWYEVTKRYSSSTGKHILNSNPVEWSDELNSQVYLLTDVEMKMLEHGATHQDIMKLKMQNLKDVESDLSKRKKIVRTWDGYQDDTPTTNIKFKIKSIDLEGEKAIVTVDIFDVIRREQGKGVDTPENYLKGELEGITPKYVENRIKGKLRYELKNYMGARFKWSDDESPNTNIEFKFNHLKK